MTRILKAMSKDIKRMIVYSYQVAETISRHQIDIKYSCM